MLAFGDSITYGFNASNVATLGYVGLLAAQLGIGTTQYAWPGAVMDDGTSNTQTSILAQMRSVDPPSRYEIVVMILGTNDLIAHGTDAGYLASFSAGLTTGLLHLTSRRRTPKPRNEREREMVSRGRKLAPIWDGPRVFVGTTPKQSVYSGSGSSAAQIAHVAAIVSTVTALQAQRPRLYLVDIDGTYDPATMSSDAPSNLHPNNTGHAAIAAKFYTTIKAAA